MQIIQPWPARLGGSPQVAAGLIGDVVDLLLSRLQCGLRLGGPLGGLAFPPGRYMTCSRCPLRSPQPAHECLIPLAVSCAAPDYPFPMSLCGDRSAERSAAPGGLAVVPFPGVSVVTWCCAVVVPWGCPAGSAGPGGWPVAADDRPGGADRLGGAVGQEPDPPALAMDHDLVMEPAK